MRPHQTLHQSIESWCRVKNLSRVVLKHLSTALKHYVLHALGYSTRALKTLEFAELCQALTMEDFIKKSIRLHQKKGSVSTLPDPQESFVDFILKVFDLQFEAAVAAGECKPSTKHNYRSALGRWLRWLVEQIWWQELLPDQIPQARPPRLKLPPRIKFSKKGTAYILQPDQRTKLLETEVSNYLEFRHTCGQKEVLKFRRSEKGYRQEPHIHSINERSLDGHIKAIYRLLGWYVNILGNPLEEANLSLLLDINLLEDYKNWLVYDRKTSHVGGIKALDAAIGIAKLKYFHETRRRNFSDIEIIQDLRDMNAAWQNKYEPEKKHNQARKWPVKELRHEELRAIVLYLKKRCASYHGKTDNLTGEGTNLEQRSPSAIVNSWLTYILVLIFVFLPVRQQEVRGNIIGETIWRRTDKQGNPYYCVSVMHKNFSKTLRKRTYKLPSLLTKELDTWINIIRPKAVSAVQSPEAWLNFVGLKFGDIARLESQLKSLQENYESSRHKESSEEAQVLRKKISASEKRLINLRNRVSSWKKAKTQLEQNPNLLFFSLQGEAFGSLLSGGTIHARVTNGVRNASFALFGYPSQTNPHAFRHIAAKHVRLIRKNTTSLSHLMGHSPEMNEDYAFQIMNEMDLTADFVDDWWER